MMPPRSSSSVNLALSASPLHRVSSMPSFSPSGPHLELSWHRSESDCKFALEAVTAAVEAAEEADRATLEAREAAQKAAQVLKTLLEQPTASSLAAETLATFITSRARFTAKAFDNASSAADTATSLAASLAAETPDHHYNLIAASHQADIAIKQAKIARNLAAEAIKAADAAERTISDYLAMLGPRPLAPVQPIVQPIIQPIRKKIVIITLVSMAALTLLVALKIFIL